MNPLLIIAIPLGLVILGMILNSFGLSLLTLQLHRNRILPRGWRRKRNHTASSLICREPSL